MAESVIRIDTDGIENLTNRIFVVCRLAMHTLGLGAVMRGQGALDRRRIERDMRGFLSRMILERGAASLSLVRGIHLLIGELSLPNKWAHFQTKHQPMQLNGAIISNAIY